MEDDYIEHQVIHHTNKTDDMPRGSSSKNNTSAFTTIISLVGGFLMVPLFCMLLGIDVTAVPVFVIFIAWGVFSLLITYIIAKFEK